MLKRIGCVIVAVATALLLVSSAGAQCLGDNLVVNGYFDNSAAGWDLGGWYWMADPGSSTGAGWAMSGYGVAKLNQDITIPHDGWYQLQYRFKQSFPEIQWFVFAAPFGDGDVAYGDRRHGSLRPPGGWERDQWHWVTGNALPGFWTKGDGLPTWIEGGTTFNLMFFWNHTGHADKVQIDNVSIRQVDLPQAYCDLRFEFDAIWDVLDGKADGGHGHEISEVTDLDVELAGKAADDHGHILADVDGLEGELDDLKGEVDLLIIAAETHTHQYLTGKGVGHNNDVAVTSDVLSELDPRESNRM